VSDIFYDQQDALGLPLDNLKLLQNSLEVLAGEEGFAALRGRRPTLRTLTSLEKQVNAFRSERATRQKEMEDVVQKQLDEAQSSLDAKLKTINEQQELNVIQRLQLASQEAADVQSEFDRKKEKLDKELQRQLDQLKLAEQKKARFRLKKMGYVFQEHSLIAELNVLENVYLPAVGDLGRTDYKQRAAEILEIVGLKDRISHYPSEISGGEQQRVAIARALINQPRTLLADEPTASLDEDSSKVVLELFCRLNRELKQTIVMVTHEPEDRQYVDRVIWMKDGHIDHG